MTTPILGIPEVSDGQIDQFLVYNNALRALEASTNDFISVSLSSADLTLTSAQFTSAQVFRTTGNAVSRTLTVPASKRLFIINNGGSAALNVTRGSTTFSVSAGNYSIFYADGTTNGLAVVGGGGGGLSNFTDTLGSSTPNSSTPVAAFSASNAATNVDVAVIPKGNGALVVAMPDNTAAGGNKRGLFAVDLQLSRAANTQVASGQYSSVHGGRNNTGSGNWSVIGGGDGNTASGSTSVVCGGISNIASGNTSYIPGGQSCVADATFSSASGYYAVTRGIYGATANASGLFGSPGDAQRCRHTLRISTSNATPTGVGSDGNAPASANQAVLPNSSAFLFRVHIVARSTADQAAFKIDGLIIRGANAAATSIIGTPTVTTIAATGGAASWSVAAAADTTNGALRINVTGAASTNIKWVADVETVEVVG